MTVKEIEDACRNGGGQMFFIRKAWGSPDTPEEEAFQCGLCQALIPATTGFTRHIEWHITLESTEPPKPGWFRWIPRG